MSKARNLIKTHVEIFTTNDHASINIMSLRMALITWLKETETDNRDIWKKEERIFRCLSIITNHIGVFGFDSTWAQKVKVNKELHKL